MANRIWRPLVIVLLLAAATPPPHLLDLLMTSIGRGEIGPAQKLSHVRGRHRINSVVHTLAQQSLAPQASGVRRPTRRAFLSRFSPHPVVVRRVSGAVNPVQMLLVRLQC